MLETFFRSFLFIPFGLLLWLVGLTLIPSGLYFIKTGRSVSAKAKPAPDDEREEAPPSSRRTEKGDYQITIQTGAPVRRKGIWLIVVGGVCLVMFAAFVVVFLVTNAFSLGELVTLLAGVALLTPVAWYFGTPPKSSS
jgi:hypothetical protein